MIANMKPAPRAPVGAGRGWRDRGTVSSPVLAFDFSRGELSLLDTTVSAPLARAGSGRRPVGQAYLNLAIVAQISALTAEPLYGRSNCNWPRPAVSPATVTMATSNTIRAT